MAGGYCGRVLRVDLTSGEMTDVVFPDAVLRQYIGGSGLGARILYEETNSETDPLGPDNVLVFMTGPLTGTRVPNAGRYEVITRSPLTGSYGEANSGGTWGGRLKRAGYDGLIITGRASKPVYIYIVDGVAEVLPAEQLWGLDTYELDDRLRAVHGEKTCSASIGPAGERLVRFAAIMNDGYAGRAAARCGVGAVMGSKNLKAISVNGQLPVRTADRDALSMTMKGWRRKLSDSMSFVTDFGTSIGVISSEECGDFPIRNWSAGSFDVTGISGPRMRETILVKPYYCEQCVIGCGREIESKGGPYPCVLGGGPEYETLGLLGANCMVGDLAAVAFANELCNRYGLDTISTGGVVSFVMEAYETGVITRDMLGGIKAEWGDADAVHALIHLIAGRHGLGDTLAEGVRIAAQRIGGLAPEFATHVRGLEFPAHDPRAAAGTGLQYATSPRGACHLSSFTNDWEIAGHFSGMGAIPPLELDRFSIKKKAGFVKVMQELMCLCDTLPFCKFIIHGTEEETLRLFTEWTSAVTGWDLDQRELLRIGERIFNLKRMYLVRDGQSRKDDVLPPKMRKRRRTGGAPDHVPHVDGMMDEYYEVRGWDEYGIPREELLRELGLSFATGLPSAECAKTTNTTVWRGGSDETTGS